MAFIEFANRETRIPREQIKTALRANGFAGPVADQIADVAIHAACQAMDKIIATVEPLAGAARLTALSVAIGVLQSEASFLSHAMSFATKVTGCDTVDVTVGGQANGCGSARPITSPGGSIHFHPERPSSRVRFRLSLRTSASRISTTAGWGPAAPPSPYSATGTASTPASAS